LNGAGKVLVGQIPDPDGPVSNDHFDRGPLPTPTQVTTTPGTLFQDTPQNLNFAQGQVGKVPVGWFTPAGRATN
jgi:hypothetical protein